MLGNLMGPGDINVKLFELCAVAIALFISLPFHEFSHAFIADKMGDHTARYQGRLTMNPFAHLNLIGSLMLLVVGFGYAKPVPVNPYNFKNPKKGMALTSLAGPVSNILLAAIAMILYKILIYTGVLTGVFASLRYLLGTFITINISLAIFNLLPVPPLDGSRIANLFLPERYYFKMMQYESYIMIGLFLLLAVGILDGPLRFLNNALFGFMDFLTGFVDLVFGFGWGGV